MRHWHLSHPVVLETVLQKDPLDTFHSPSFTLSYETCYYFKFCVVRHQEKSLHKTSGVKSNMKSTLSFSVLATSALIKKQNSDSYFSTLTSEVRTKFSWAPNGLHQPHTASGVWQPWFPAMVWERSLLRSWQALLWARVTQCRATVSAGRPIVYILGRSLCPCASVLSISFVTDAKGPGLKVVQDRCCHSC